MKIRKKKFSSSSSELRNYATDHASVWVGSITLLKVVVVALYLFPALDGLQYFGVSCQFFINFSLFETYFCWILFVCLNTYFFLVFIINFFGLNTKFFNNTLWVWIPILFWVFKIHFFSILFFLNTHFLGLNTYFILGFYRTYCN